MIYIFVRRDSFVAIRSFATDPPPPRSDAGVPCSALRTDRSAIPTCKTLLSVLVHLRWCSLPVHSPFAVLSPLYVVPLSQAGPPISLPDDLAPAGSAGVFVRTAFSPHTIYLLNYSHYNEGHILYLYMLKLRLVTTHFLKQP
ncbi:uncharacterized protein LOC112682181 [Sipha flava]|uniref:Uncharacterized protein LOC112682181 n=1 Tax=Sipha flava TaxID=143950 RepID=A0A8B8FDQ8_9HEMI|nr:uncharacterized protein LOC112682181 [Sipha flava]